MISVRQARVLPPSFFRFCLTTDTLDLGYILPTAGWIRDFHPLERALTGRTNTAADWFVGGWFHMLEKLSFICLHDTPALCKDQSIPPPKSPVPTIDIAPFFAN